MTRITTVQFGRNYVPGNARAPTKVIVQPGVLSTKVTANSSPSSSFALNIFDFNDFSQHSVRLALRPAIAPRSLPAITNHHLYARDEPNAYSVHAQETLQRLYLENVVPEGRPVMSGRAPSTQSHTRDDDSDGDGMHTRGQYTREEGQMNIGEMTPRSVQMAMAHRTGTGLKVVVRRQSADATDYNNNNNNNRQHHSHSGGGISSSVHPHIFNPSGLSQQEGNSRDSSRRGSLALSEGRSELPVHQKGRAPSSASHFSSAADEDVGEAYRLEHGLSETQREPSPLSHGEGKSNVSLARGKAPPNADPTDSFGVVSWQHRIPQWVKPLPTFTQPKKQPKGSGEIDLPTSIPAVWNKGLPGWKLSPLTVTRRSASSLGFHSPSSTRRRDVTGRVSAPLERPHVPPPPWTAELDLLHSVMQDRNSSKARSTMHAGPTADYNNNNNDAQQQQQQQQPQPELYLQMLQRIQPKKSVMLQERTD